MSRWLAPASLVAAAAYLALLGWGMQRWSYDIWGALLVVPILSALSVPVLRRCFRKDPAVLRIVYLGLAAKFAGAGLRYWVTFDAYGGAADAVRYHDYGKLVGGQIRDGSVSVLRVVPSGIGTAFIENLTAAVYTVFGSSRLGGFLVFGWLGYWGAVLYLRAAVLAVPGLATRRYAAMTMLLPSLLFWPSSLGKEAWMMLTLGLAAYGAARVYVGRRPMRSTLLTAAGLAGAALVRPHMGGMWLAAITLGLLGSLFMRGDTDGVKRSKVVSFALLLVAVVGLSFVAAFAIRYLQPGIENESTPSGSINRAFAETERRSEIGGSSFQTIDVTSPANWPFAIVRTLTRPLPQEADSIATLLPAAEMLVLFFLAAVGWRRFVNVPRSLRRTPYLVFALSASLMFGLAFTSIGNLGILARQRSLVLPLFTLIWCLPPTKKPEIKAAATGTRIGALATR